MPQLSNRVTHQTPAANGAPGGVPLDRLQRTRAHLEARVRRRGVQASRGARLPQTTTPQAATRCSMAAPVRITLGILLGGAAVAHLALVRPHAAEEPAFGVFFAAAGLVQLLLAGRLVLRRAPERWVFTWVRASSLFLVALWLLTRVVAPPLTGPSGTGEPVSALGVLAGAVELASVTVVLAVPLHSAARGPTKVSVVLGPTAVGVAFVGLFAMAAGMVIYSAAGWGVSTTIPALGLQDVPALGPPGPQVTLVLTGRVAVMGPLLTLLMLALCGVILAATLHLVHRAAQLGSEPSVRQRPAVALGPAFVALPACCGAPLLGALAGAGALSALAGITPWVLAAVAVLLSLQGGLALRRLRSM